MKTISNPIIWILLVLITSCTSIEEPGVKDETSSQTATRSLSLEDPHEHSTMAQREAIALWFANNYSLLEAKRVHMAITSAVANGLDEILYLKEYASPNPSSNKISKEGISETSKAFAEEFGRVSEASGSAKANSFGSSTFPVTDNEYLQIYWPNSDDWDGSSTPVFVYAPENVNTLRTYGYQVNLAGRPKKILVDEAYCEQHPVWIINESETPFKHIPNFNKGEYKSSNGTVYSQALGPIGGGSFDFEEQEIATTVRIGTVKSTKQHDSWICGGSEYVFRFGTFENTSLTCIADTSKFEPLVSTTKISFTRKEIKKGITKELNAIAVSHWPKKLQEVAMLLVEEDPGKDNQSFDVNLGFSWKDFKFSMAISVPFKNHDDEIARRIYAREFILSSNNQDDNGDWMPDTSDGVYWTLPVKRGLITDPPIVRPAH